MAAGLQLRLQRELFDPHGEQLLALVECAAVEKKSKRREVYLCLLNEVQQSQFYISIAELRGTGGADPNELPKKKRAWAMRELTAVDGGGEGEGFALDFEAGGAVATTNWSAVRPEDKKRSVAALVA